MPLRRSVSHYSLNMTHCRWPPCCSVHFCSRDGKNAVTRCCVSLRIPWIPYRIRCLKWSVLEGRVSCTFLFTHPQIEPQNKASGQVRRFPRKAKWICLETLSESLLAWRSVVWAAAPNTIVHDDGQYGSVTYQTNWFLTSKYRQVFLAHLDRPLPWSCRTRLIPLGLHQKQDTWNKPCRNWLLKIANSGVYWRDPYRNVTCYAILPLQLLECIERHGGHLQSATFQQ